MNEDYCTTFRLAEDIIVIRFVNDYRQVVYRFQYSIQIIWNSRFTWRHIMQHLRESTYHFNFLVEHIHMDIQNNYNNIGSEEIFNHSTRELEIVDVFLDIANHEYAFSEMICSFLVRPFTMDAGVDTYAYHPSHSRIWASKMHEASIDL